MAEVTIDDLARALDAADLDAEAWRRWMASDTADAALVRDVLAATEALLRGDLDRAAYGARMAALWAYWRERLEMLGPDAAP
jgi:hypothetical protein